MKLFIREKHYRKKSGAISTYFTLQRTVFCGSFKSREEAEAEVKRLEREAEDARQREIERATAKCKG